MTTDVMKITKSTHKGYRTKGTLPHTTICLPVKGTLPLPTTIDVLRKGTLPLH